ncbi:polysaccharide lyase family 8 super-sandwich domain-containing protein [Thermophagus sp. OGC60D27]|uniref:polysaccharide lyase family 8 super-sandwich domain-containing protein n=1 Tax=Thermophagus sp. OGC60D27 TaxID=3458415 RepID=UPI0040383E4A
MKMHKTITFFGLLFVYFAISFSVMAQDSPKEKAVAEFRKYFSQHAYRGHQLTKPKTEQITSQQSVELLGNDGRFVDLIAAQEKIETQQLNLQRKTESQHFVGETLEKAFNRIWRIAQLYRGKKYEQYKNDPVLTKLFKAINNYSKIEADRGSIENGRFHISCFAIPTAAVNTYFCLFDAMEAVENGQENSEMAVTANQYLKQMGFQSWTQPYRNDETDKNPVSVDRFRKHVWWVGGNGLGFRSLLPTAAAMNSVEMMDVLAVVAKGALSWVSQNTYDESFWTEGFTADGAGWGHGMQCLIWGYPISGTSAALNLIKYFKGTPWAKQLDNANAQALLNYYRGSSWYYYKGYIPRSLGRGSMEYTPLVEKKIGTAEMIKGAVKDWIDSFSDEEQKELLDLQEDIKDNRIVMEGYPDGLYNGTRWFFNNDNLIKKNPDYYIFVSMASVRCDGIEMAHNMADKFNFFTCDGLTFLMKEGNEYHKAIGAWNLTALPGVTARQVDEDDLIPMTNWRGYCSLHNFAAAATSGTKNAAAGFIFEKMNASEKNNVNDPVGKEDPNDLIYCVKAYKGYFMADDYMVALGAGITNKKPNMEGDIWTTIDQTHYNCSVKFMEDSKVQKINGNKSVEFSDKEMIWVSHKDGFDYAVLPQYTTGKVFLQTETRNTKWEKINEANKRIKNKTEKEDIFQMYINHGRQVNNGSYAYVVYAGEKKAKKAFEKMPLEILVNTTDIQAVAWDGRYLGASFYNPDEILGIKENKIRVSAPCALLLEKNEDGWTLTVTDAQMNEDLKYIEVKTTFNWKGDVVEKDGAWSIVTVPMPQGDLCGKPASVKLRFDGEL